MDDKSKEARNSYMRAWRKNNPDRVKKIQEQYWQRKSQQQIIEEKEIQKS